MDQFTYERPREKLLSRGAASLSTVELVQLILGSGTAYSSVAAIARKVVAVLDESSVTDINSFQQINGLGLAQSARLLAAIQLGQRYPRAKSTYFHRIDYKNIKVKRHASIVSATLDGSGELIKSYEETYTHNESPALTAKSVISQAVKVNAHGLAVAIILGSHTRQELSVNAFVAALKSYATSLQIRLFYVVVVKGGAYEVAHGRY